MGHSENYLQSVVRGQIGAAVILDQAGRVVAANTVATNQYGFNIGEAFCQRFEEPVKAKIEVEASVCSTSNHLFSLCLIERESLAIFGSRVLPVPVAKAQPPSDDFVLLRIEAQSNLSARFNMAPVDQLEKLNQRLRFEIERRIALELENANLEKEVQKDRKTQLLTQEGLEAGLRQIVKSAPEMPLVMIYLDLNDFKAINDRLGHDAGDLAIAEVGRVLRENLRQNDLAARLGGDEFAVVLWGKYRRDQIAQFVKQLHKLIGRPLVYHDPMTEIDHSIELSFCAGVAQYPSDTRDISLLTTFADSAMYSAKEKEGRSDGRGNSPSEASVGLSHAHAQPIS